MYDVQASVQTYERCTLDRLGRRLGGRSKADQNKSVYKTLTRVKEAKNLCQYFGNWRFVVSTPHWVRIHNKIYTIAL